MKKIKKLIILTVSLFFLYGCGLETALLLGLGAGGGVAGYKYVEGHTAKEFPLEFASAWDATNTAMENLRINIADSDNSGNQGKIKAFTKEGKEVSIKLKGRSQWVTSISVRVGKLGNRENAEKILNEIASVAGL